MSKKFYVTTPLYYVNASPHVGHSYTNIASDTIARYMRLKGREVYFLTGTDEHGQKIALAASSAGKTPREFADEIVPKFTELWQMLDVSYDDFIRTTEARHEKAVQKVLQILYEKKDIYEGEYKGWYCTPCETFWTKLQLEAPICPDCGRQLDEISERNYFFSLSKYQRWLKEHIESHPEFILPKTRRNEILGVLEEPLQDLCVSRPRARVSWGVPVPFSEGHVTYVWFDALINYISAPGFLGDEKKFKRLWPADLHVIGKDILRHHAIYWPIMLHALGIEPPKTIFAHGWWTLAGEKISKSKGIIVDPLAVVQNYGTDALRYFLLREVSFGLDGVYSEKAFITRYNSDLANDLGNLLNRTLTMVEKYFEGRVPEPEEGTDLDRILLEKSSALPKAVEGYMERYDFSDVLVSIWEVVNCANKYIEDSAPWTLAREGKTARLKTLVYNLIEVLRIVTIFVSPFIPRAAKKMWDQLGFKEKLSEASFEEGARWGGTKAGLQVKKGKPLFPRIIK